MGAWVFLAGVWGRIPWTELATLSSLLYGGGLVASLSVTSASTFGNTTGLLVSATVPRGPSGTGPPMDIRGPRGGAGGERCNIRPRPGDLDLELRGMNCRVSRSRLADRRRILEAREGGSRSRLIRRGGVRLRAGLSERGRGAGWKVRGGSGERWRPTTKRYSSFVRCCNGGSPLGLAFLQVSRSVGCAK